VDELFSAVFATCVLAALIAWVISTERADTGPTGAAASQAGPPERTERRQERRHERSAILAPGLSRPLTGEIGAENAQPPPSNRDDAAINDSSNTVPERASSMASAKMPDSQRPERSENNSAARDQQSPKSSNIRELAQLPPKFSGDSNNPVSKGPPPLASAKVPNSQRAGRSQNSLTAKDLEAPKSWKIHDLAQLPQNLSAIVPSKATPTLAEVASTTSSAAPPAPQSSVMKFVTATSSLFLASLTASGGSEQEETRHLYRHRERKLRGVWSCVSPCFRGYPGTILQSCQ